MATFTTATGTGTFQVATPDGRIPDQQKALNYSIEHIPYSNVDVLDMGGFSAPLIKWPLIVLAANIAGLVARLGETGTLTETSFSTTATLLSVENRIKNYDGTHYWCDALWIIS
jgi:hypothetical protein